MKPKQSKEDFFWEMEKKTAKSINLPNSKESLFFKMLTKEVKGISKSGITVSANPLLYILFLKISPKMLDKILTTKKTLSLEKELRILFCDILRNIALENSDLIINYYDNDLSKMLEKMKEMKMK